MRKKLFVILLFTSYTSLSHAQSNFFHRANFDTLKFSWGSNIKVVGNNIYQFGMYERQKPTIASYKPYYSKYDLQGDLQFINKFDSLNFSDSISYYPESPGLKIYNGSKLFTSGTNLYEPYRASGNVYMFDTISNYAYITEKQDSDIYFHNLVIQGEWLYVLGHISDTFLDRTEAYLVKYDTGLNKIWERKWDWGESDYPRGIHATSDSGVIFAVASGMPYYAWEGHLVKVSKDGDIVFDKYNPSVLGRGSLRLFDFDEQNNRLLFVRGYYEDPMYYMFKAKLIMTDTALNLVWEKSWTIDSLNEIDNAYDIWNGIRVNDGYVICGTQNQGFEGWVFKTDFEGNMLWEATYRDLPNVSWGSLYYFFITGIDTLPDDRGYILSGSTNDSVNRPVAFIMSIDKDGCFSDDTCEAKQYVSITYYAPAIRAQVFPNPFTNTLQIKIENAQLNGAELIITDLLGRTVAREKLQKELTTFYTQNWAEGIYVWSLVEDGLVVKSGKVVKE